MLPPEKRRVRIQIMLPPQVLADLRREARERGMTLTALILERILR